MKTFLTYGLLLTLTLSWSIANSQTCTRPVEAFMAAPGGYAISGTALLEYSDFMALYIDSAFNTLAGPDLHVYLAKNFEAPTAAGNTNVDLGQLLSNSGAQSYDIPIGVAIGDYDYVLIHCKTFNHWWGGGLLGDINCGVATHNLPDASSVLLYPNPATNFVTLKSQGHPINKIQVTDMMGTIRIMQSISNQDLLNIDISELSTGLYCMVGINSQGELLFRKMITKM